LSLDAPGFWDEGRYFNVPVRPLFTWTLLDEAGTEIPLTFRKRSWTPAVLTQEYAVRTAWGNIVREQKAVLPNDTAACTVCLRNRSRHPVTLHVLAWTAVGSGSDYDARSVSHVTDAGGRISFARTTRTPHRPDFQYTAVMGFEGRADSFAVQESESTAPKPAWKLTPTSESFVRGKLPSAIRFAGEDAGTVFMALHKKVLLRPGESTSVTFGMALGRDSFDAGQSLSRVLPSSPATLSEMIWREYFDTVPYFECDDIRLTRYYWYRWYGLRLNTICAGEGNYAYPFVCEGIGYFRAPISYSAPCHILENRWQHTPALAQGSLMTFIDNQRPDGAFRGYVDRDFYREEMFYHAMWGTALKELERTHPSREFLAEAYDGLKKYAQYFDRERDAEVSGLYDIDNHYETGQEYMNRYLAVRPDADREAWGEVFRLKGVDATIYIYDLKRALAEAAVTLGRNEEADLWNMEAERIKSAVLETMWDPDDEMFYDVNPSTGERTRIRAAVCFYPYLTDIVSDIHISGLKRHLFRKSEFWTRFPVPSSAVSDPMFSAQPVWKGTWRNCPWNGRVWPMVNSHIAEMLARSSVRFNDRALRVRSARFIKSFISMMFFDGDATRPNCFEHYNPFTGNPSVYRGIDDYQHSWVVDLIIRYACGIRPEEGRIVIDPFPFGLHRAIIENVVIGRRRISVAIRRNTFSVFEKGKKVEESRLGRMIVLTDSRQPDR
jgi:hypothetical protein